MSRNLVAVAFVLSLTSFALAQTAPPATQPAAAVPVKAVVLFSSGVGYFEHFGTVTGNATAELRFKTNQINDILKSLILQDLDKGTISTITYPSQDPIAKTLRSFQVDITGNPTLAELLNQLRGAKISVAVGATRLTGIVLGVEKRKLPVDEGKQTIETSVLNLITDTGIRALDLQQVSAIELADKNLQDELSQALSALAQARDQDKKPVTIHFAGDGERRVRLGYVVETPIWKTSYRLVLGQDEKKPELSSKLLGWAIVENQTDNDWSNVQLSLVSGRPISFIQDLYQPLYIPRPVVQPELYASLRPQTYDEGMAIEGEKKGKQLEANARREDRARAGKDGDVEAKEELSKAGERGFAAGTPGAAFNKPMDATASVTSVASASKVGELFQYTVPNVTLPRQRSAMLPIVTDSVEIERLSIYNQSVLAKNPLNGARVKNITGKHLLAGPVTVLDGGAYAGDARIDNLPPNQERLLSYGIDLQMLVNATAHNQTQEILTGKIAKGVLEVTYKSLQSQEYVAQNKGEKDKTLLVEHPVRQSWTLVETDKPIESTEAVHRFKVVVPAGQQKTLAVKQQLVRGQQFSILNMDLGALEVYRTTGTIPAKVKDALAKAGELKRAMVDADRKINETQTRINEINTEQERLRRNLQTVRPNEDYYNRLLKKLNDQETVIEKLQGELADQRTAMQAQRKALEDYLAGLNVE